MGTAYSDEGFYERGLTREGLLRTGLAAGIAAAAAGNLAAAADAAALATPRRGGRFRVGMQSGGNAETIDPNKMVNESDLGRVANLYERLLIWDRRTTAVTPWLAQEMSPSRDLKTWRMRIRDGVLWHDGSRLTADDIVYSLRYMGNPKNKSGALSDVSFLNASSIRRRDATTVELTLRDPNALVAEILSARTIYIFKNGTTAKDFDKPIGTGPFKFKSFRRGSRSLFVRNDDYRIHDGPYVDELEIISFSDPTAKFNALVGGEIDAQNDLDIKLVKVVKANPRLRILFAPSAFWLPLTMTVDQEPFRDNRVRQAFRLMTDRKQMVRNVLLGQGTVGNDLFSPIDPDYAREIPQRSYDPERARSLLRQAGKEGLTVSLYTSDAAAGMLESAQLFVSQAKKAGVTVNLDKVPADQYWTDRYLKAPFAQSGWAYRPLFNQMSQAVYKSSPYNETHWVRNDFERLTRQAIRTLDKKKRRELWVEAQRILWNEGGYIIWGFSANVDAYSAKVRGLLPNKGRWLNFYDFTNVYLT